MTILTISKILLVFFIALFIKEIALFIKELFSRSKKTDHLFILFKSKLEELIKEIEGKRKACKESLSFIKKLSECCETKFEFRVFNDYLTKIYYDYPKLSQRIDEIKFNHEYELKNLKSHYESKQKEFNEKLNWEKCRIDKITTIDPKLKEKILNYSNTKFLIGESIYIAKSEIKKPSSSEKFKHLKIFSVEVKSITLEPNTSREPLETRIYEIYNKGEFVLTKNSCVLIEENCYETDNLFSDYNKLYKGDYNFTNYFGNYLYSDNKDALRKGIYNLKIKELKKDINESDNSIQILQKEINNLTNKNQ